MILRELFSKISVDTKAALANVMKFDAALDETSDSLEDVERKAESLGGDLDKAARKSKGFGRSIADAFKRAGKSAFDARSKIKDTGKEVADTLGKTAAGTAAAAIGVGALTLKWAEGAQELDNLSKRFQISTDELQSVTGAMKVMGLESEDALETIKELRIRLGEAEREGSTPLKDALIDLGINFKSFSAMPVIDQLGLVADRLSEVESESRKNQIANDLAGEDLIKLFPLLDKQSKGLEKLIKQSKEFGLVQSKTTIKNGAELAKNWKILTALGGNLVNLVSSKLEPAFSSLVVQGIEWIRVNDDIVSGGLADFFERLVNLGIDFLPVATDMADGLLDVVEGIGSVDGAIIALLGTMASWKLATSSLLGAGGPWVAGITGIITLLGVLSSKLDAEDRRISRVARRRLQGLGFRLRGEFTDEELQQSAPGQRALALEQEREELIRKREGLKLPTNLEEAAEILRNTYTAEFGNAGFNSAAAIDQRVREEIENIKKLELAIEEYRGLINEQLDLVRQEKIRVSNEEQRMRNRERREREEKRKEEEATKRTRVRELTAEFNRGDPKDFAAKLRSELIGLITELGLEFPEGLVLEPGDKPKRKGRAKKEKTIEELIGLGDGVKTISDLVPAGQGTTINNFAFNTTVQPARVEITVNSPEGTSAIEVAQEAATGFAEWVSDQIYADQREIIGQTR